MPLREYLCKYCSHQYDDYVTSTDPDEYRYSICRCGSKAEVLPSMIGGYTGNMGGASTRPKNSTAMKKKKVFTQHPFNEGEPEGKPFEDKEPADEPEQIEMNFGKKD